MKRLKFVVSVMALVLAVGAALAGSVENDFMTSVWRKPDIGGVCAATSCMLTGAIDCSDPGFTYFSNSNCTGSIVAPKRN